MERYAEVLMGKYCSVAQTLRHGVDVSWDVSFEEARPNEGVQLVKTLRNT